MFLGMLPQYLGIYVTLQMKQYPTFDALKKFVREYTRIIIHQAALKKSPPVYGVDHDGGGQEEGETPEEYDDDEQE